MNCKGGSQHHSVSRALLPLSQHTIGILHFALPPVSAPFYRNSKHTAENVKIHVKQLLHFSQHIMFCQQQNELKNVQLLQLTRFRIDYLITQT